MATERSLFLINNARPDLAVSPRFEVREGAVRLTAAGIEGDSYVKLKKQVSPQVGSFAAVWADVIRQGQAVRLSQNSIEHLELVSGVYEVEFVGAGEDVGENVIVYLEEDQRGLDSRIQYTLPSYNPNFNGQVTGTGLSPALIGSRAVIGEWMVVVDSGVKRYVWAERVVDTSTGAVISARTYDSPAKLVEVTAPTGSEVATPAQGIALASERVMPVTVNNVTNETINLLTYVATVIDPQLASVTKITIIVDSGSMMLEDGFSNSITLSAGETFVFEPKNPCGTFSGNVLDTLTLATATGPDEFVIDAARVVFQYDLIATDLVS